jgi:ubiquinone biosynthesis protein
MRDFQDQPGFGPFAPYQGLPRRFFLLLQHVGGLLAGSLVAYVRILPAERKHGLQYRGVRLLAMLVKPFLNPEIASLPFPSQLRRRLEIAGPTYVKFGQIMAVREDMLPSSITNELKNLFERLPEVPFAQIRAIIEGSLQQPVEELFSRIDERPLGSASIAQVHLAETKHGERVVIKVIKPGVRKAMLAELKLLQILSFGLQGVIPRYQPRQLIEEFCAYTQREIDFTFEADNSEIFAMNFRAMPAVVFPKIYRALSTDNVLTMEFLDGLKPTSSLTHELSEEARIRIVDLGAEAILRMLYQHGFFHADLHAGNLIILPGEPIRLGFIDLGMVGRFEDETRCRMLYYFHALVNGDIVWATKYLSELARVGTGSDIQGFRRAVMDLSRRFVMHSAQGGFSIARLILESIGLGGRYRVFFRVELILMVKALVTFEGVGRMMDPTLDVVAISQAHMARIFREHFDPRLLTHELLRDTLRNSPEMLDLLVQLPRLLTEGFKSLEESPREPAPLMPIAGLRSSIIAGSCIIGGVLTLVHGGPSLLWVGLFSVGFLLYIFGKQGSS